MSKVKFQDLSGWLKFAFIWTMISVGVTAAYLLLLFIIILFAIVI